VLIPPSRETIALSHKLQFDTTNNVVEYEALILGVEIAHKMGVKNISFFGDSKFFVQHIKRKYQSKHLRMCFYRNYVGEMINNFFNTFNIIEIPREEHL